MKKRTRALPTWLLAGCLLAACGNNNSTESAAGGSESATPAKAGQSAVQDDQSQKDVVKVAIGSADHTTLVKALQQAEYVDVLSNAGPFTVFAPTNAAFDKLPAGTLDNLMKPENKDQLRTVLEYHVFIGGLKPDMLQDGQTYGQASGQNITVGVKDGKITINGKANVLGTVPASNGIIYIIDEVLSPPAK